MMQIRLTEKALRQYEKLPAVIQHKADKQFRYLVSDFRHPSLNAKKYGGQDNLWQGRIDKSYQFYFHVIDPHYVIVSVINHPK